MSGIPKGWALANLSEILSSDGIVSDGDWVESKDQDANGEVRLIQLADIGDGVFINKSNRFMNSEQTERLRCTFLKEGDVLIARMPDPLGRACLFPQLPNNAVTVVDVCLVRLTSSSALKNKLFMYWVNSPKIRDLIDMQASGTTRRRITRKKLALFDFPIPPLNEQIRIADKLDSMLAKVDTAQARLDKIPNILKRFRQSVLAAATSGELTKEWRGGENLAKDWKQCKFATLLLNIRSGSGLKPNDEVGIPILRSSAVRNLNIDYTDCRQLDNNLKINSNDYLERDDLLFTRLSGTADYVGNCGRVCDIESKTIQYPDRLFRAKLKDPKLSNFLELYFCAPKFRKYITSNLSSSAGHQRITIGVLKEVDVELPTIDEQKEIVRRVESLFSMADTVEKQYKDAKARTNRLTQSILAKAFRGELVSQDPNDEPASELLARIKANLDNVTAKPKVKRKTKAA